MPPGFFGEPRFGFKWNPDANRVAPLSRMNTMPRSLTPEITGGTLKVVATPVTRYLPSRHYLSAGLVALGLAVFSTWCGFRWSPAFIPAALFLVSGALILLVAFQPAIEIHETHLKIGSRQIPWNQVRRLDRTGWISPLVLHLTLADGHRILLIYPGDLDSANGLLRQLRWHAREALIDGIPHRQFWGESLNSALERCHMPSPRYQLLCPEDEAEVERLFRQLKTVGHFDPKKPVDEK